MFERMSQAGLTMAMLAGAVAAIVFTPSHASACSFAPPSIEIVGKSQAGGTLELEGDNWFYAPGGVSPSCEGTILPLGPVTIVASYTTLSGPRSLALTAQVSGEASNNLDQPYTFHAQVAIPPDATAVDVEARSGGESAVDTAMIAGATATTVPPAPTTSGTANTAGTSGTPAPPATAVAGVPSFTG